MEISVLRSCYLRKGTWKFLCSSPCYMSRQGTWKFPCSFPCYLRKARYVEIFKYLLAYVCKGFQKEQFLHFHALIFRLSAENITIRIVFGKNYALCTKFYQMKQKPNHVWKEL